MNQLLFQFSGIYKKQLLPEGYHELYSFAVAEIEAHVKLL